MNFADEWASVFPGCVAETRTPGKSQKINNAAFDNEFEEFVKMQKKLRAERQAKEAEEKAKQEVAEQAVEEQPTDVVAEEAYQAFVAEDEKPKSKKKKKTEEVVEETSTETPVVED